MSRFDAAIDALQVPPTSPQGVAPSKFDAAIDALAPATNANTNLMLSVDTAPDQAAQQYNLGARYGLPPAAVAADQAAFVKQAQIEDVTKALAAAPTTQAWMAKDLNNAAVAHDQLANLSEVERAWENIKHLGAATAGVPRAFSTALQKNVSDIITPYISLISPRAEEAMTGYVTERANLAAQAVKSEREQVVSRNMAERVIYGATGSLMTQVPTMAAAFIASGGNLARTGAISLEAMAAQTAGEAYVESKAKGQGTTQAMTYAGFMGFTEKFFEKPVMDALLGGAKSGFVSYVRDLAVKEGWGEAKTAFWQDAATWLQLNPEKTVAEFLAEEPQRLLEAGLTGMVGGSMQAGLFQAVSKTGEAIGAMTRKRQQEAQTATTFAEQVNNISTSIAEMSKRVPEKAKDFVEHQTQGAMVHIDAQDFINTLAQSKVELDTLMEQLPSIRDTFQLAAETEGVLSIPLSEYTTVVAQTAAGAEMSKHIRATPDALSQAEAEEVATGAAESVAQEAGALLDQAEQSAPVESAAAAVATQIAAEAQVAKDLAAQGVTTPQVSQGQVKASAKVIARAYATLAEDLAQSGQTEYEGMDAAKLMQVMPLRIKPVAEDGSKPAKGKKGTLEQKDRAYYDMAGSDAATIRMTQAADFSSYTHEGMHHFVELYAHFALQEGAPQRIKDKLQGMMDFAGVKDAQAWSQMSIEEKRPHHEKLAEAWETYIFEGTSPNIGMTKMFQEFTKWMKDIYVSLRNMNVQLTPEIRQVFDRMLASEAAIEEARAARNVARAITRGDTSTPAEKASETAAEEDMLSDAEASLLRRSLRDMKWLSGARSRALKALQAQANDVRDTIRVEEAARMNGESVWQAVAAMKGRGGKLDGSVVSQILLMESEKLAIAKYTNKGAGRHPDIVATEHNFLSAQEMIIEITNDHMGDYDAALQDRVDTRMMEEHAELNSPDKLALAADKSLHSDAMLRFLATGYKRLTQTDLSPRVMVAGIKQAVMLKINTTKYKDINPNNYAAKAARAGREMGKSILRKDITAAQMHRQTQLVQSAMAKEAYDVKEELDTGIQKVKDFLNRPEDKLAKRYDMNYVNAMKVVAGWYSVKPTPEGKSPMDYLSTLEANDPARHAELVAMLADARTAAERVNGDINQATVETARAVLEVLDVLKTKARQEKEITLEGKKVELAAVREGLVADLSKITSRFTDEEAGRLRKATKMDEIKSDILSFGAASKSMESWVKSLGNSAGSAWDQVFRTVRNATDAMRRDEAVYLTKFKEALANVTGNPSAKFASPIVATELNNYRFTTTSEIMGFLMHMGNESSTRKNLVGRRFATVRDVNGLEVVDTTAAWSFLRRMVDDGVLDKSHFDAMQKIWDTMEELKPLAQKAHYHREGRYFKEVEATPFVMQFKDGTVATYRGGYVPAMADKFAAPELATKQETQIDALADTINVMMPTAPDGFTQSRKRVDYPLEMDISILGRHISNVLRYAHIGVAVHDVQRAVQGHGVQAELATRDPQAYNSLILPWLNRAAKQTVSLTGRTRSEKAGDRFYQRVRIGTTIGLMFSNVANTAQQITGISTGAALASPSTIARGLLNDVIHREKTRQFMYAKSTFMQNRGTHAAAVAREELDALVYDQNVIEKSEEWSKRHAFYLQTMAQNFVDSAVWTAAYDDAVANRGIAKANGVDSMDDEACVQWADSVIRRTQGSMAPEDLAHWAEGGAFHLMFKMFRNYFDMNRNLILSEASRALKTEGPSGAAKRIAYITLTAFTLNALMADLVVKVLANNWEDFEDEDGDGWLDDYFNWFFKTQGKYVLAMGSLAGQVLVAAINSTDEDHQFGDRLNLSPVISLAGTGTQTAGDVADWVREGEMPTRIVTDTTALVQLFTPIPVSIVNRPYRYWTGVSEGKFVQPEGVVEAVAGTVVGRGAKE